MTIQRLEAIHNLLFSGEDINESSINNKIARPSISTMPSYITDGFVAEVANTLATPVAGCNDDIDAQILKMASLQEYVNNSIDIINRKIYLDIIPSIKGLLVSDPNTVALSTALAIMPYDDVWSSESTAKISSDSIISSSNTGNTFTSVKDQLAISASVSDIGGSLRASVAKTDDIYKFKYISRYKSEKRFVLDIDRSGTEQFNAVKLDSSKLLKISVMTSDDGKNFSNTSIRLKKTAGSLFPIDPTSSRYVRIIVDLESNSNYINSEYHYEFDLNIDFGVLSSDRGVFFETKEIAVNQTGTVLSIFDDSTGNIRYEISINDEPYRFLSSINGSGEYDKYLNINNFSSNKLVSLKDFTYDGVKYVSSTEIPPEFVASNYIRAFDNSSTWTKTKFGYVGNFIAYNAKTINLGQNRAIINGTIRSGTVELSPGIYEIEVFKENCLELYNEDNIKEDLGYFDYERRIIDSAGIQRGIQDTLYPNNHLYLIKDTFDYALGVDLIENIDYSIYNNNSSYVLSSAKKSDEIILSYMLAQTAIDTIKLRGVFSNNTTLSSVSKILVNIS